MRLADPARPVRVKYHPMVRAPARAPLGRCHSAGATQLSGSRLPGLRIAINCAGLRLLPPEARWLTANSGLAISGVALQQRGFGLSVSVSQGMPRPPRTLLQPEPEEGYSLVEVTSRTIQGRFLLRPSRWLRLTTIGILARGLSRHRVQIHGYSFLSNHYHLILSAADARELASFMEYVNGNLAREAGRRHDWRARFYAGRYRAIEISREPAAQLGRLRYVLAHGAKEGLVASPLDWPGAHCARPLLDGRPAVGIWHDRTAEYRARTRGRRVSSGAFVTEEVLPLTPLPALAHLGSKEQRAAVREMIHDIEHEAARRHAIHRSSPLGASVILSLDPHQSADLPERKAAPKVHAASAAVRDRMLDALRIFVRAYRAASARDRAGLEARFPAGCFPSPPQFVPIRPG